MKNTNHEAMLLNYINQYKTFIATLTGSPLEKFTACMKWSYEQRSTVDSEFPYACILTRNEIELTLVLNPTKKKQKLFAMFNQSNIHENCSVFIHFYTHTTNIDARYGIGKSRVVIAQMNID